MFAAREFMAESKRTAIILAAGKSTRMKSALPKPLQPVCGRPMLGYILDAAYAAGVEKALVVVGHGKEQVIEAFADDDRVEFVEQKEQLGTGHAAKVCIPSLQASGDGSEDVLILAGDTPLVLGDSLKKLTDEHASAGADATMGTAFLDDPFGYGRVMRDGMGHFVKIVEQNDASPDEAAVKEVFPSLYCLKASALIDALGKLQNDNAKSEYYLTDVFEIIQNGGGTVLATHCVTPEEIIAPNTRGQLQQADEAMQQRIQAELADTGVGIAGPVYIEYGASVGVDSFIAPFSFVGRGARVGERCSVGPFGLVAAGAVVADDSTIAGNASPAMPVGGPGNV